MNRLPLKRMSLRIYRILRSSGRPRNDFFLRRHIGNDFWHLLGIHGIADLPAVQWKLLNIRRVDPADHRQAVSKLKAYLGLQSDPLLTTPHA